MRQATRSGVFHALRRALPWALLLSPVVLAGCQSRPVGQAGHSAPTAAADGVRFVDVAQAAGLHDRWQLPGGHPVTILSTIGNGCAFLDYNNDGNLDILLVGPQLKLYQGDGRGHFTDVSHATGLDKFHGHFLGVAVGDYDNDGYDDLYISGYHTGLLLHNEHGKFFKDVTKEAGLKPLEWGTSAAFGDIENDGRLDLYVGNYVHFGPGTPQLCPQPGGVMSSCGPATYAPLKGVLYRNMGHGKFVDVTHAWGADKTSGKVLGVAFADFNGSGRQSLALANDVLPADLLENVGGRFRNVGPSSGVAYLDTGGVQAGMGLDWGDYDNDGRLDLVIVNFESEPKSLYRNLGGDYFENRTRLSGLAAATAAQLSFGVKWLDFDNSGWLGLLIANGHISDNVAAYEPGRTFLQRPQLLENDHGRRFTDVSAQAGTAFQQPILGRGLAIGDYDNDGRMDALIVNSDGAPLLLHNETAPAGHWLEVRLLGTRSNRDGYGALLTAVVKGRKMLRLCHADGSYLSSSDKRVHFGLGADTVVQTLQVHWPSGHVDRFVNVPADRIVTVREGSPHLVPSGK